MRPLFSLKNRLAAVADMVPPGAVLADVGTDHAYLPVWLLRSGKIPRALCGDVKQGPLAAARRTAQKYGCEPQMEFILSDGLAGFTPEQMDAIVIAGMGADTQIGILSAATAFWDSRYSFILQPMSKQERLIAWLDEHGFVIEEQRIAAEGKRRYLCIKTRYREGEQP